MGNYGMRIGFLTGMLVGCFLVLLFLKMTRKDGSLKCKYDERQQLVRGRGFQYGFFSWMVFNGIYITIDLGLGKKYMDTSMVLYCGMVVGGVVYIIYSIWHDGYFSLNENPKRLLFLFITITLLNGACAFERIHEGLLDHGVLTLINGANRFLAAAAVLVLIVLFVKWYSDSKKTE
ncbi:MAG: hypothetical protein K2N87_20150 [Eubacterium sp.]|nr:hypothetical protein [Eubacterium sp.]